MNIAGALKILGLMGNVDRKTEYKIGPEDVI